MENKQNKYENKKECKKGNKECQHDKSNCHHQEIIKKLNDEINHLKNKISSDEKVFLNKLTEKSQQASKIIDEKVNEIKTQSQKEIANAKKYAIEPYACELIDIVNQFDKALSYEPTDEKIKAYQQGFKMFINMFKTCLDNMNIKQLKVSIGDEFDGKTMECLELVESSEQKNTVVEIINPGYILHDRVIKPTLVKISK